MNNQNEKYLEAIKYLEYNKEEGKLYFKYVSPKWNRTRPYQRPCGSFVSRRGASGNLCKPRWVLNYNVQGRGGKNSKLSMCKLVYLIHGMEIPDGFAVTSKFEHSIRIEHLYLRKITEENKYE